MPSVIFKNRYKPAGNRNTRYTGAQNKFYSTKEFSDWYKKRESASRFTGIDEQSKRLAPQVSTYPSKDRIAPGISFNKGDPIFFNSQTREYTTDPQFDRVYGIEMASRPGSTIWAKGEADAKLLSDSEGTKPVPVTYDSDAELFFQSLVKDIPPTDIVSNYSEDLSNEALYSVVTNLDVAKRLDRALLGNMTEQELLKTIKDWESQGYVITEYGQMDMKQKAQAQGIETGEDWTKLTETQIGAFKKILPEELFLLERAGPSMASEKTIYTESAKTGLLEPTILYKDLSTKLLDYQNVVNSPFGIVSDVMSLRGYLGRTRNNSPQFDLSLAYTLDPLFAFTEFIDESLFSGVRASKKRQYKKLMGKKEYREATNTKEKKEALLGGTYAHEVATNLNNLFGFVKENIARAKERVKYSEEHPESVYAPARYLGSVGLSIESATEQARAKVEQERKASIAAAEAFREQAKLAMNSGNAEDAVDYIMQAQNIDRVLGISYWEDIEIDTDADLKDRIKNKYQNGVGALYSKLNSSVYEDWTWAIKPELEEKFLRNTAYAELQLGRPLTVFEINTLRNKYSDMSLSVLGDIALDPSTYVGCGVLDVAAVGGKKLFGKAAVLTRGLNKVEKVTKGASTTGSKFSERLLSSMGSGIKVPVSAGNAEKMASDAITKGAGKVSIEAEEAARKLVGSPTVKVALRDWLAASATRLSVKSAGNKLFHAVYSLSVPMADFVRLTLKNVDNQTLPDIIKEISKHLNSEGELLGAIEQGLVPKMSMSDVKLWVKLKNSVDADTLVQLAEQAQDSVLHNAFKGVRDEVEIAIDNINLATPRAKELLLAFNKRWDELLNEEGRVTLKKWAGMKVGNLTPPLTGKNKMFASREEAKRVMMGWLDGPELDSYWKLRFYDDQLGSVASKYGVLEADNARKIALEFAESVRKSWLNQLGVTKLWQEADITTDSLLASLVDVLPANWFTKGMTGGGEEIATNLRKSLIQFRNVYKASLNFIFSAVLSGRPGYLFTNWIDSNFRALVYGVKMGDDFNNAMLYFQSRGIKVPADIFQAMSRDFLGDPNSMTSKVMNGEWDVARNPFANWIRCQKYQFGEAGRLDRVKLAKSAKQEAERRIKGPLSVGDMLKYSATDMTQKAWLSTTRPIRSFTNANADFNNLTEIVVRVKTYHKLYVSNLASTQETFLKKVLEKVSPENRKLAEALIKKSGINSLGFGELVKTKNGSAMYSQFVPETVQKILRGMDPVESTLVGDSVLSAHEQLLMANKHLPIAEQRRLSMEFFDQTIKDYADEVENSASYLKGKLEGVHTGGTPSDVDVTESMDEISDSLDDGDVFILDEELIRMQNDLEAGRAINDSVVADALKKRGIKTEKGKARQTLKKSVDDMNSSMHGDGPLDEVGSVYNQRGKIYEKMSESAKYEWDLLRGPNSPYKDHPDMLSAIEDEIASNRDSFKEVYRIFNDGTERGNERIVEIMHAKLTGESVIGSLQRFLSQKVYAWKVHMPDGSSGPSTAKFYAWLVNAKRAKFNMFSNAVKGADIGDFSSLEWDMPRFLGMLGINVDYDNATNMIKRVTFQSFDKESPGKLVLKQENQIREFMEALFGSPRFDLPDRFIIEHGDTGITAPDLSDVVAFPTVPVIFDSWTGRELSQTPKVLGYIGSGDIPMAIKQAIINLDITDATRTANLTEDSILNRLLASARALKHPLSKEISEAKSLVEIGKIFSNKTDELFELVAHAGNQIVKEGRPARLSQMVNKELMGGIARKLSAAHWSSNSIRFAIRLIRTVADSRAAVLGISSDEFILRSLAGVSNMDKNLKPILTMTEDGQVIKHSPLKEILKTTLTKKTYKSGREVIKEIERNGLGNFDLDEPNIQPFLKWLASDEVSEESLTKFSDEFAAKFAGSVVVDKRGNPLVVHHGTDADFPINEIRVSPRTPSSEFGSHWGTLQQANDAINKKLFGDIMPDSAKLDGSKTAQMKSAYLASRNPFLIDDDITNWTPSNIERFLRARGSEEDIEIANQIQIRSFNLVIRSASFPNDTEWLKAIGRVVPDVLEERGYDSIKYLNLFEGMFNYPSKEELEIFSDLIKDASAEDRIKIIARYKDNYSYIVWNTDQLIPKIDAVSKTSGGLSIDDIMRKIDELEIDDIRKTAGEYSDNTNKNWDGSLRMASTINRPSVVKKLEEVLPDGTMDEATLVNILKKNGMNLKSPEFEKLNLVFSSGWFGGKTTKESIIKFVKQREAQLLSMNPAVGESMIKIMSADTDTFRRLFYTEWDGIRGGGFLMQDGKMYTMNNNFAHAIQEGKLQELLQAEYPDLDMSAVLPKDFGAVRVINNPTSNEVHGFEVFSKMNGDQIDSITDFLSTISSGRTIAFDITDSKYATKTILFTSTGSGEGVRKFLKGINDQTDKPLYKQINNLAFNDKANVVHGMTDFLYDGRALISIITQSKNPTVFVHEAAHWIMPYLSAGEWETFMDWATTSSYTSDMADKLGKTSLLKLSRNGSEMVPVMVGDNYVGKYISLAEFQSLHETVAINHGGSIKERLQYKEIQEAFANGWTVHIAGLGGGMPSGLRKLYERISKSFRDFYLKHIKGGVMDVKLTPEMRELYSNLTGMYPEQELTPGKMKLKKNVPISGLRVYKMPSGSSRFGQDVVQYSTTRDVPNLEIDDTETILNFHRPYIISNAIDEKMLFKGMDRQSPDFGTTVRKWLRSNGYDGLFIKNGLGNYIVIDYKLTEEESEIWKAIINNPRRPLRSYGTDINGMDLSSPDSFLEAAKQRMNVALSDGHPKIAEGWRIIITDVENLLNGIPRAGENTINDMPIPTVPEISLKEGLRTYADLLQYNVSRLDKVNSMLIEWKSGINKMFDDLENGVDTLNYLSTPDDSVWKELQDASPDIMKEMNELNDILISGGTYEGIKVTGALNKTNDILLDYTTNYEWENLPRLIFPFWQFPTRSAPFWVKTLATHPEVIRYYTKYQLISNRQRMQGGMVNSKGEPSVSFAGYVRIPGTDYWWNPTASLSFRILFPSAYSGQVDEDYNERSMLGKVINTMNNTAKMRGVSMNPFLQSIAVRAGLIEDEMQQYSIIPQMDLVPRYYQRAILSGLRKIGWDNAPELWSPSVTYKDYLIEQLILKDVLMQVEQLRKDSTSDKQFESEAYLLTANVGELLKKGPEERKKDKLWIKYRNKYEASESAKSWVTFLVGVNGKKYTAADAQFNELRNEVNLLKTSINDSVTRKIFDVAETPTEAYDKFTKKQYDSPEGDIYTYMQNVRWITDLNGNDLTGDERINRVAERSIEAEKKSAYYDSLSSKYEARDKALSQLPIGAPSSVRMPIIEQFYKEVEELDKQFGKSLSAKYSIYNKPVESIFTYFENKWWTALTESEPHWDSSKESYSEYKKRRDQWIADLPELSKTAGDVFLASIREQMNALYATTIEGGPVDIMQTKAEQAKAEQMILELMQAQGNYDGYIRHKRTNDTATDALLEAWTEIYLSKYYEKTEGKRSEAYILAEREFLSQYPKPPTFEALAEWVLSTYPTGKFTIDELRAAYNDADEEVLSVDERQLYGADEKEAIHEQIMDLLEIVGPGNLSTDFDNIYSSPHIGGTRDDISKMYNDWEELTVQELTGILDRVKETATEFRLNDPSNDELIARTVARGQNDDLKLLVEAELGSRFYEDQSWFYGLSYGDQSVYLKENPEFKSMLEIYKQIKAQYAEQYPIWARYYYKKPKSGTTTTSSGENSGGGGGGGSGWTSKNYLQKYTPEGNQVSMGYRTSLDSNKLLADVLGKRGAAGQPNWPDSKMKELEFNIWKSSMPEGMEEAMGELMIDALKQYFIYGTKLSESSMLFLSKLATNHPDWVSFIKSITG